MADVNGTSNPGKSPWPHGLFMFQSGDVDIEASKTNHVWDVFLAPFDFTIVSAQCISQTLTEGTAITIDVVDEAGTPQVFFNDLALAAITAGAADGDAVVEDTTPDDLDEVVTGRGLKFRYTSGSSDTSVGTRVRIFVKPRFS